MSEHYMFAIFITRKISHEKLASYKIHEQMHFLCFGFVKHASHAIETKPKKSFFHVKCLIVEMEHP